jgi:TPR repeat protein
MLGLMYQEGKDVPKDPERAARYYRQAVESGSPVSMYQLGRLHADREIAAADQVEGYMWLVLAQKVGKARGACELVHECKEWAIKDRPAYRSRLESGLTVEQKSEAERRAAAWLEARPSIRR